MLKQATTASGESAEILFDRSKFHFWINTKTTKN